MNTADLNLAQGIVDRARAALGPDLGHSVTDLLADNLTDWPLAKCKAVAAIIADPEAQWGPLPPWPVDRDRFWYLLEVLPPCKWRRMAGGCESFHVSERLSGNVVTWCVRIGENFFELQDLDTRDHAYVVELCRASVQS